jgi:integrative and conjugative element protein (TIGR02256 family)
MNLRSIGSARSAMKSDRPQQRAWLARECLSRMVENAKRFAPYETGGLLLGYRGEDGEPVITHVVLPGPEASHYKDAFVPDYAHDLDEVARLYAVCSRHIDYLGDWHSHPGTAAYMSPRDKRALRKIATYRRARAPRPVMIILSGMTRTWEPKAWQGAMIGFTCCKRFRIRAIELSVFESR